MSVRISNGSSWSNIFAVSVLCRVGKEDSPRRRSFQLVQNSDPGLGALDEVVDAEQNESAEQRHEEAGGLAWLIVSDGAAEVCSEEGAGDADEHRDPEATRIPSGHDELGDDADDEPDDRSPQQRKHKSSSRCSLARLPGPVSGVGKGYSLRGGMRGFR